MNIGNTNKHSKITLGESILYLDTKCPSDIGYDMFQTTSKIVDSKLWVTTRELLTRHTWNISRMSTNIQL
jgi:hypothetical protein